MSHLSKQLQPHRPFIILVPILILIVSFPTILFVIHPDAVAFPHNRDSYMHLWNSWYMGKVLSGSHDLYYTNFVFYPEGVTLAYHSYSLIQMVLTRIFDLILPPSNAYNLAILVIVYLSALSGYVYILYLTNHRWASLFGACVFAISPHVLMRAHQPDISTVAVIPICLYLLEHAIREQKWKWVVSAGVFFGLCAFFSLYLFVCVVLSVALRTLILLAQDANWRNWRVWRVLIVFGMIAVVVSLTRVYPMISSPGELSEALTKEAEELHTVETDSDILMSVVNTANPFFGSIQQEIWGYSHGLERTYYLSYICIGLIIFGLLRKAVRRQILLWMVVFVPFFVLRLGSFLTINDVTNYDVILPKFYLNQLLPMMFKSFHASGHFQIGVMLPFALMATYGLMALAEQVKKRQSAIIFVMLMLVLVETYVVLGSKAVPEAESIFYTQLAEGEHERGALINLPMGREHSKSYIYYQTIHELPQAEGLVSRTSELAYATIEGNPALKAWRNLDVFSCEGEGKETYLPVMDDLRQLQFVYVIVHKTFEDAESFAESFASNTPYFENEYINVYKVAELYDECATRE